MNSSAYDDVTDLKFLDFSKTQKFRYLKNETFFLE